MTLASDTPPSISTPPLSIGIVFAAGRGTRLRPHTLSLPKPCLRVGGRTLLDHALDMLAQAGIRRAAVNVHWLAEAIASTIRARLARGDLAPHVLISDERARLLDTGGGARAALALLFPHEPATPFVALNADALFMPNAKVLATLSTGFAATMDARLALARLPERPCADFALSADGRLTRAGPYTYVGAQLARAALLADTPAAFSLNLAWDAAIAKGRLFGVAINPTHWLHVGTPEQLARARAQWR